MENPPAETGILTAHRTFTLLAFLLILSGLILVYAAPVQQDILMPGPIWLCVAGVIIFIGGNLYRPGRRSQALFARLPLSGPAFWIILAVLLSILATAAMLSFEKGNRVNYIPVITFWLFSALCYLSAFSNNIFSRTRFKGWVKSYWREALMVGGITIVAIILRFYKLGEIPYVINGDEGLMGLAAQSTKGGVLANPFELWENFGALYLQLIDFSFKLFGATPFALRLLPAIGGVLAVPSIYLLARQVAGKRAAAIAASLLAISHTHMHFSRTAAVGYIHSTWLVPLELYFLLSGIEKRSSWRTALAGILLAIHFSIYLTSQIVVALVLIFIVVAFLFLRSWIRGAGRQVLTFWGGFMTMLMPETVYVIQHPAEFFDRLSQNGTFQSGWLAQSMASTGHGAIQILAERVLHAFLALIYYPAIDFYGSPIPMLSIITAALFLVGMVIAFGQTRTPSFLLLNGYFWAFLLAVGIFSIPPSADSYRMLMALPAALIMAAIGFEYILDSLGVGWKNSKTGYTVATTAVLLSLLVFNQWTYYDDFHERCLYGDDIKGRFASYLGDYASTVDHGATVYLLRDNDIFYGSHASVDFLNHGRANIVNVAESVDTLSPIAGESIVASPSRIQELEPWARLHPEGELTRVYDCQNLIMLIYEVP